MLTFFSSAWAELDPKEFTQQVGLAIQNKDGAKILQLVRENPKTAEQVQAISERVAQAAGKENGDANLAKVSAIMAKMLADSRRIVELEQKPKGAVVKFKNLAVELYQKVKAVIKGLFIRLRNLLS